MCDVLDDEKTTAIDNSKNISEDEILTESVCEEEYIELAKCRDKEFQEWIIEHNITEDDLRFIVSYSRKRMLLFLVTSIMTAGLTLNLFLEAWSQKKIFKRRSFTPIIGPVYGIVSLMTYITYLLIIPLIIHIRSKAKGGLGGGLQRLFDKQLIGVGSKGSQNRVLYNHSANKSIGINIIVSSVLSIVIFAAYAVFSVYNKQLLDIFYIVYIGSYTVCSTMFLIGLLVCRSKINFRYTKLTNIESCKPTSESKGIIALGILLVLISVAFQFGFYGMNISEIEKNQNLTEAANSYESTSNYGGYTGDTDTAYDNIITEVTTDAEQSTSETTEESNNYDDIVTDDYDINEQIYDKRGDYYYDNSLGLDKEIAWDLIERYNHSDFLLYYFTNYYGEESINKSDVSYESYGPAYPVYGINNVDDLRNRMCEYFTINGFNSIYINDNYGEWYTTENGSVYFNENIGRGGACVEKESMSVERISNDTYIVTARDYWTWQGYYYFTIVYDNSSGSFKIDGLKTEAAY